MGMLCRVNEGGLDKRVFEGDVRVFRLRRDGTNSMLLQGKILCSGLHRTFSRGYTSIPGLGMWGVQNLQQSGRSVEIFIKVTEFVGSQYEKSSRTFPVSHGN